MQRSAPHLRRGALLIRGPSWLTANGSRLCGASLRAAPRSGHERSALREHPHPAPTQASPSEQTRGGCRAQLLGLAEPKGHKHLVIILAAYLQGPALKSVLFEPGRAIKPMGCGV